MDINLGNLIHGGISGPFSAFLAKDGWAFIHAWSPLLLYVFILQSVKLSLLVILFWECFETFVSESVKFIAGKFPDLFKESTIQWFGEVPSDSLLGDIIQGIAAIAWGWYILRSAGFKAAEYSENKPKWDWYKKYMELGLIITIWVWITDFVPTYIITGNEILEKKTTSERWRRLFQFLIFQWSTIVSTLTIVNKDPESMELFEIIPFGFWIFLFFHLLLLSWCLYDDYKIFYPFTYRLKRLYTLVFFYFGSNGLLNMTFAFGTYITYWCTMPIIFLLSLGI